MIPTVWETLFHACSEIMKKYKVKRKLHRGIRETEEAALIKEKFV